jgi:hypothetical protein
MHAPAGEGVSHFYYENAHRVVDRIAIFSESLSTWSRAGTLRLLDGTGAEGRDA